MLWLYSHKLASFWWLEIETAEPQCTYYYGPFKSALEAECHQPGYVEDLVAEQAHGITVNIRQCQPETLTIVSTENSDWPSPSIPAP